MHCSLCYHTYIDKDIEITPPSTIPFVVLVQVIPSWARP